MEHVYDFYKPDLTSEYPIVDGHFSVTCYTRALDKCYQYYNAKYDKKAKVANGVSNGHTQHDEAKGIDRFAHIAFHAPTCKLVQKSYARLAYNDYLSSPTNKEFASLDESVTSVDYEKSLTDKGVEKAFMTLTKKKFAERVYPGTFAPRLVGNMYTASVYSSLASILIETPAEALKGQRIGVFSYGSGLASSFFSLKVVGDVSEIAKNLDFKTAMEQRVKLAPELYEEVLCLTFLSLMKVTQAARGGSFI
jgi:hydroxymethylglutaryl-CoA synthase